MIKERPQILCFGEALYDVFPTYKKIGGAPLNVAYHLHKLGIKTDIISRVGRDELGKGILNQVSEWGLSKEYIQIDSNHETSRVIANVQQDGDTTYDILAPVAWDFITLNKRQKQLIKTVDAFVFGSLSARNPESQETLFALIEDAQYAVCDINLRKPYYNKSSVFEILEKVDLLKLNHEELRIISEWIGYKNQREEEQTKILRNEFYIDELLITKGKEGASYYSEKEIYNVSSYPVEVANTVGSGDAFLAAFLEGKFVFPSLTVEKKLDRASLLGAYVAGQDSACPDYDEAVLRGFKNQFEDLVD